MVPGDLSIKESQLIDNFLNRIKDDPRISMTHITTYLSLVHYYYACGKANPIYVFTKQIMPTCKISGVATYHKSIRQLHEYGYIKYVPSYNRFIGSLVDVNIL